MNEFVDRYDALGMNQPDPSKVCKGDCEGTGWVPVYNIPDLKNLKKNQCYPVFETDTELLELWEVAHRDGHRFGKSISIAFRAYVLEGEGNIIKRFYDFWVGVGELLDCDGWHFVKCPTCKGTGVESD